MLHIQHRFLLVPLWSVLDARKLQFSMLSFNCRFASVGEKTHKAWPLYLNAITPLGTIFDAFPGMFGHEGIARTVGFGLYSGKRNPGTSSRCASYASLALCKSGFTPHWMAAGSLLSSSSFLGKLEKTAGCKPSKRGLHH